MGVRRSGTLRSEKENVVGACCWAFEGGGEEEEEDEESEEEEEEEEDKVEARGRAAHCWAPHRRLCLKPQE